MRTSDIAILAALGIGGYYLITKGQNQQSLLPGGGGSSPINLDLSGLLNGLSGMGGQAGGFSVPDFSGFISNFQGLLSEAGKQTQGIFDFANIGATGLLGEANQQAQDILNAANKAAQGITDKAKEIIPSIPNIPSIPSIPNIPRIPNVGTSKINWQGVKERGAGDFMAVGGAYVAKLTIPMLIEAIAPRLAASLGGKLALGATGVGVPLAIAWAGADILATGYELATGKDVPIVGFGELFHVSQTEENTGNNRDKAQIPEKVITQNEAVPSPTREAPRYAWDRQGNPYPAMVPKTSMPISVEMNIEKSVRNHFAKVKGF